MKPEPLALIKTITYATLAVAGLALSVPLALNREWLPAIAALWLCAIAAPAPNVPRGRLLSDITFAGTVILAGYLAAQWARPFWALLAVAAATATWDLQHFITRLPPTSELAPTSELTASEPAELAGSDLPDRGRLARSAPPQEQNTEEPDVRSALVHSHLQRLGITLGISLILGALALVIRVDYSLRTLALLALALIVGLSSAVGYVRRRSD